MRMKNGFLLVLALGMFSLSCGSGQDNSRSLQNSMEQYRQVLFDRSKPLDKFLLKVKNHYEVPAIAAALISLEGIEKKAAVGVKNYHEPDAIDINDIFCIGSCGKSMTATLIAMMVEEGKLNWNTRPVDLFPQLTEKIHPGFRNITMGQILSHTAGIQQYVSDRDFFSVEEATGGLAGTIVEQRKKFTIWNLTRPPANNAGTHAYSNGGYAIAAAMVEKISGQSWESLMHRYLFKRLNLHSAFIGMPEQTNKTNARRHRLRDSHDKPLPLAFDSRQISPLFYPAGIISMSVSDFATYALFHLRGLMGMGKTLKTGTFEHLHQQVTGITNQRGYSLGWFTIKTDDVYISTHSGSDSSIYAVITIDRKRKMAGVVMCNMGDSQASTACANVMLELFPKLENPAGTARVAR